MARIAGVDLPRDKRVEIGLTYIFGIGLTLSREILNKTGISAMHLQIIKWKATCAGKNPSTLSV